MIDPAIYERGYTEAQIKIMEERAKKEHSFDTFKSVNLLFTGSIDKYEYDQLGYVLTLFRQSKVGNLPFRGSTSEQPAQIIEIFGVLEQLEFEANQKAQAEAKREQQRLKNRPK